MNVEVERPRTLPEIAAASLISLDRLREFVRKRPRLADTAVRIGGTRVFGRAAAAQIVAEYRGIAEVSDASRVLGRFAQ